MAFSGTRCSHERLLPVHDMLMATFLLHRCLTKPLLHAWL